MVLSFAFEKQLDGGAGLGLGGLGVGRVRFGDRNCGGEMSVWERLFLGGVSGPLVFSLCTGM